MDRETYLTSAFNIIQSLYPPHAATGLTAAKAGAIVQRALPLHWQQLGFEKFGDVLAELERKGWIRVGPDSKYALAIWLNETSRPPTPSPTVPTVAPKPTGSSFLPLGKEVWNAFMGEWPPGRRFLNRKDGTVRVEVFETLPPEQWAEIKPVGRDTQREWALQLLESKGLGQDQSFKQALESPRWYLELLERLGQRDPGLLAAWRRLRSANIIEEILKWCSENGVDKERILAPSRVSSSLPALAPAVQETAGLRDVLLSAISKMATSELLDLSIPAKYVVEAIRPDLLRQPANPNTSR